MPPKKDNNRIENNNPNLFQLITNQIRVILQWMYKLAENIAHYFGYLQKPGINVIVSILFLFILGKMYKSLAKSYYENYHSTIFRFCVGWWVFFLMVIVVLNTLFSFW